MELDKTHILEKCQDFDFMTPPFEPIEFSKQLVKLMYEKNGLGVAANQVGVLYRIFAMRGSPENFVVFNPRVVDASLESVTLEEGCLSYPGLLVPIERPKMIKVRFQTPNGDTRTDKFIGMTARCFLHEMMHMEGKPFFENVSRYTLEKAIKKAKKQGFNYEGTGMMRFCR